MKGFFVFFGVGEPEARQRKVTISARVQVASGENVVSEVPVVIFFSTAHCTASVYHVPSGTSAKPPAAKAMPLNRPAASRSVRTKLSMRLVFIVLLLSYVFRVFHPR